MGIIRKLYGKAILSEKLGDIVDKKINAHIAENNYELIGSPISLEDNETYDPDSQEEFHFSFELGIAPEINLRFDEEEAFDYYKITSDDEGLDKHIEALRLQHGETIEGDTVKQGDVIIGEMTELDENGELTDNTLEATIVFDKIKDETTKKAFEGKKTGDIITFNPLVTTGSKDETANLLKIDVAEVGDKTADYQFKITKINRVKPAELNEEFFKNIFPGEDKPATNYESLKKHIWEKSQAYYEGESDAFFARQVLDKIIDRTRTGLELPKEFVIKYHLLKDNDLSKSQLEEDWENISKSIISQLIYAKIGGELQIDVSQNDVRDQVYYSLVQMYGMEDYPGLRQIFEEHVDRILKDKKEYQHAYEMAFDRKLQEAIVEKMKKNIIEVSFQKFKEIVKKYHEKVEGEEVKEEKEEKEEKKEEKK